MRRRTKPARVKVEGKRPPARKSSKTDAARVRDFELRLAEALEQLQACNRELLETQERQTATSEVLRVISQSPTDVQPVLRAVAESAARLCEAIDAQIFRVDGGLLRLVASHGPLVLPDQQLHVGRGSVTGRSVVDRRTIHIHDLSTEVDTEFPDAKDNQRRVGHRTTLATPLMRQGVPLGAILIRRLEVKPFTGKQIELLKTFADQAVIAIENVRLFKELEARNGALTQALEQQTATAEILQVISGLPTDVQPVFDTIVRSAPRLCGAKYCLLYQFDGELLHLVAHHNVTGELLDTLHRLYPMRPSRQHAAGRAVMSAAVVEIQDALSDPEYQQKIAVLGGWRSMVAVPMLREGAPIGAIVIQRADAGAFPERQIALLRTFAEQAVISIENVRLFKELQEKNRALTQAHAQITVALEQQMATSEVLKVISRSTFDLQPVLETLIENATRLCGADRGQVYRVEGEMLRSAIAYGIAPEASDYLDQRPLRIGADSMAGRAALERRTIHCADLLGEPWFRLSEREKVLGLRTALAVPMLRGETLVGVFTIWKTVVEPFTVRQIEVVTTFADQAVIAIENVNLVQELQARTRELARSVEELKALGEVGQAVSSTLEVETVLETIVSRAVQLSGSDSGIIYEFDEDTQTFRARATHRVTSEHLEALRATPIRFGEGAVGHSVVMRTPVQVPDIADERMFVAPQTRALLVREGLGSLLAVPLVREERVLGGLVILRRALGAVSPEVVVTLQTFATQSVLAIQNARLFREIGDKSRQLEAASRHKSEFLANMSHELRTPLNAVIGFSEVLLQRMFGELNAKQDEYLRDIYASGQHLLSLINDILDLSKIEAGRMELAPAPFHLPSALENAVTLVRERAARHGIALEVDVDPWLGELVGDERKVKQVLLNLLSNAVKFTPEGGRISVTAGRRDGVVEIAVTDTGIGIAPEDQAAIFEEFRQVGSDETRKQEGTGLGLTLARKFVELHGGRIWVESEPGRGSTFTFTLPLGAL